MMCANEEETCSEWRSGMMICLWYKTLWKVEEFFLEDKKIVLRLNYFSTVGSFFNAEDSEHNSADDVARVLRKEGADSCFTFKLDALLRS